MTLVPEPLLTPSEVAALFRVDPKTVTRWAVSGHLPAIRTVGGHRRYREADVRKLLGVVEPVPAPVVVALTCKGQSGCDRKVAAESLEAARRIASVHGWVGDCCPAHKPRPRPADPRPAGGVTPVNNNRGGRP